MIIVASLLTGCSISLRGERIAETAMPLTPSRAAVAIPDMLMPSSPGIRVKSTDGAVIDYSNAHDGYVTVRVLEYTLKRVKVLITGPDGTRYVYNLAPNGMYEVFPLTAGDGEYIVGVFEQVTGEKYAMVISTTVDVILFNEFAPFLRPNQLVNYNRDSQAIKKAAELTADADSLISRIATIYNFVVNNINYDIALAENVQAGYLPDIDAVLARKKGICLDYAALMAAMLRSQGIPTKLVVGYSGNALHAWVSVYSEEEGWMLMDPTFSATGNKNRKAMMFIGDGANYQALYQY